MQFQNLFIRFLKSLDSKPTHFFNWRIDSDQFNFFWFTGFSSSRLFPFLQSSFDGGWHRGLTSFLNQINQFFKSGSNEMSHSVGSLNKYELCSSMTNPNLSLVLIHLWQRIFFLVWKVRHVSCPSLNRQLKGWIYVETFCGSFEQLKFTLLIFIGLSLASKFK